MDGLEWWRNNEERFPTIAQLARQVLPIQASSAASERVFSVAAWLLKPRSRSMTPANLHAKIVGMKNLKLVRELTAAGRAKASQAK
jgi:zinc finger BED domain-containing protein 1 (E3 SUMO-protein ligase ZBED1)